MPQEILRQNSWTAGELDPQLVRRRDIKPYAKAAAGLLNMQPTTQGPLVRRPGMADTDRVRGTLVALDASGATLTGPNGGAVANVIDGDDDTGMVTSTVMGVVDPYVVVEIEFAAPVTVHLVDLTDLAAVAVAGDGSGGGTRPPVPTQPTPWTPPGGGYSPPRNWNIP